MNDGKQTSLHHEQLDVYRLYLEVVGVCDKAISGAARPIAAFEHLDRAMESIGVNLMRANAQALGSAQRIHYLDVSIASTHECAASLDVLLALRGMENSACAASMGKLWRIRGMLLGMRRASANQIREESGPYGRPMFPFMALDMYQGNECNRLTITATITVDD